LRIEYADLSLVGDREDNQDRVAIAVRDAAAFMIVLDGMGGHSDGSRAADTALKSLLDSFHQISLPAFDPLGFLHLALSKAHDDVRLGFGQSMESRPRATTAVCLVQEGAAYWAHIGDSRVYWIRRGQVLERTRDHSHVELLLREGKITEQEVATHPMRNFVECCLGGDPAIPEMTIAGRRVLTPGDVILLCTPTSRDSSATKAICALGSRRSVAAPCRHPRRSATTPPQQSCAGSATKPGLLSGAVDCMIGGHAYHPLNSLAARHS
jgi:serine/threonine protein phosphatase PrpC